MAETQSAVIKYQAKDGQDITLSFETIRKYLVHGKSEHVTPQELMFFMGACKSQGMNPFKRDCWLIKYSPTDAAAIITAIGFLKSRAKAMPDCKGWQAGIIVKRGNEIIYSNGLMLESDVLLGGWAKGKPEGWETETTKEVNLRGYIKHTRDGMVTRFWKEENQPTQIAKVAEAQLLRTLWPDEFQNLYTDAEISPDDGIKALPEISLTPSGQPEEGQAPAQQLIDKFDVKISEKENVNLEKLSEYLALCASSQEGATTDDVKASAIRKGFDKFWGFYTDWLKSEKVELAGEKKGDEDQIRKLYKGLGDPKFQEFVDSHATAIPGMAQIYQDEIRASWITRAKKKDGLLEGKVYPLDVPREEVPDKEVMKAAEEGVSQETEIRANYLDQMRQIMDVFPNRSAYHEALKELGEYSSMNDVSPEMEGVVLKALNLKLDELNQ